MNIYESDILKNIIINGFTKQRDIADSTGHSLGKVNSTLSDLISQEYLTDDKKPTRKSLLMFEGFRPKNAIILAAGYGLRMVPLNTEIPKGLLEVHSETLIERTIKQLHEAKITEIYIVVGYQKEKYEYLIDTYGVELIVNMEYGTKNNLFSLQKASEHLGNSYIIPCDLYSKRNPYSIYEPYDWYMVSDRVTPKSSVRLNRGSRLIPVSDRESGNAMLGISYLTQNTAAELKKTMNRWCGTSLHDDRFWDDALFATPGISVNARLVNDSEVREIDTFDQLRSLDSSSEQLKTEAMRIIADTFDIDISQITDIRTLKKGMTNRSFLFTVRGERYIMRIPGEGTDKLIDRKEEADVYAAIAGSGICDDVLYMDPDTGYKITRYLEGARECDASNEDDLKLCIRKLREFHQQQLTVPHYFDIFDQIDHYESLWPDPVSVYRDHADTKKHVLELKAYIDAQPKTCCLTHIDAVADNFLIIEDGYDNSVRLIDWEYAGMQDPHVDIAMFCIYSLYDKSQVDRFIDMYFENKCPHAARIKIYAYISACGLLWSDWCEYKSRLGIEFGEYALRQYRYAKEYYRYAINGMDTENE